MNIDFVFSEELLAEADRCLQEVFDMRELFETENKIENTRLRRRDVFHDWVDPYSPNYFIAYCRTAAEVNLRAASLFQKLQWLLDDVVAWQEAIIDRSPKPFEFEMRCLDEIRKEKAALQEIVILMKGDVYWSDYCGK